MRKKDGYVEAFLYLISFIAIQLVVTYVVFLGWHLINGKRIQDIMSALGSGNIALPVRMIIVIQVVFSILVMALFLWRRWCVVSRSYLQSKPWAVLAWASVAALGTLIPSEVFEELVPLPDTSGGTLAGVMSSRWGYLAICIFAPVVEELVFRGAVLRALLNACRYHWVAITLSALAFAIVHANPAQMPHAFLMGLMLGWMYYRTKSVIPGIMVHWVNNTVAYAVYNILPQADDVRLVDLWGEDPMRIGLAVAFSIIIIIPALLQLHLRMRPAPETPGDNYNP